MDHNELLNFTVKKCSDNSIILINNDSSIDKSIEITVPKFFMKKHKLRLFSVFGEIYLTSNLIASRRRLHQGNKQKANIIHVNQNISRSFLSSNIDFAFSNPLFNSINIKRGHVSIVIQGIKVSYST